jgi:hypothetical protein
VDSEFDSLGSGLLAQRNKVLDGLFTLLMFVGLVLPLTVCLVFLRNKPPSSPGVLVGLGLLSFGLMVVLPVTVIAAITLRDGASRLREFWRYYEVKWGIGLRGIAWVYIPIATLAPIGLMLIILGT